MGTSHFSSNVKGNVKVTVASVNATNLKIGTKIDTPTLKASTIASAPTVHGTTKVKAGSYFQLGAHQYIFFGTKPSESLVIADATQYDASVKGSLYLSANATKGQLWYFTSDTQASVVSGVAA